MKVDLEKRKRVMELSMRLGHCICDPRRTCPCDVFRDDHICPCAGERPDPVDLSQLKLTQMVRNAGCASKISPADLDAVLRRLPPVNDPAVISGLAAADDAAIYRLSENLCLVQTVDVFTPCVDDPELFGRICAANCLSDIYAMGGEPRNALSILAFPSEKLDGEIMFQMLAGAMRTLGEAGVSLIGGHSIKDEEIKLGFAVTGTIDPAVAASLESARAGDLLVLTKPLGTGILAFCQQIGRTHNTGLAEAARFMAELNRGAAEAMREAGGSACTDITGFGLFGHLLRLSRQSKLTAEVFADRLPAFPGALEPFREGIIPGAVERNREYVGMDLEIADDVEPSSVSLGCDAQTSGGLLIAIAPEKLEHLQAALSRRNARGWVIGRFCEASTGAIRLVASDKTNSQRKAATAAAPVISAGPLIQHEPGCCSEFSNLSATAPGTAGQAQRQFGAFMRTVQAAGELDEKTKELLLFTVVVYSRCAPCFDSHYERARELGYTQQALDEAAWCAISMGGAPVRMFYQENLRRLQGDKG